ncbi:MAG: glycine cleavage system protein H [Candidatus Omnitrophica bacterium CG11_big_fil_rev_8_21_14_0_20_41_12]|nr:MAG: glycine cleavage system protein H [Candidatus Omnitrophica bacterium CG11_big_fil_rev_8_21_14_0_20_41_12]
MNIPKNLFYTKDHEWARIEGKTAYIGITDYAQHSLGDITFIELPKIGEELKQSGYCATVESVKAASEVYAPLSGKVLSVNTELAAHPELINQSAYEKGYFISLEISDVAEKTKLMDAASYERYVEGLTK